jgi:hypothetical protein
MSFARLLLPTCFIQVDSLYAERILEGCDMRVIEGDVTVFSKPKQTQSDWLLTKEHFVPAALCLEVKCVPIKIMRLTRMHFLDQVSIHPAAEACRVRFG